MTDMGVVHEPTKVEHAGAVRPGEWLEYSPLFTILISGFGLAYLAREVAGGGFRVLLDLNHYIFLFLVVGLLLHWRPRNFVQAVNASIPSVAGVLIQYPLYAGIVKMMTESGTRDKTSARLRCRIQRSHVSRSRRNLFGVSGFVYSFSGREVAH
jgi:short-chain fatty acids transporter